MIIERHPLPEMEPFYLDAERQLLEFDKIIPLKNNNASTTYSPRFFNMMLLIGSQVDSLLRILLNSLKIKPRSRNFHEYYSSLNTNGLLSNQKVECRLNHKTVQPFKKLIPEWWNKYNESKHSLPFGPETIRLNHVVEALAGLYVLHDLAGTIEIIIDLVDELPEQYRDTSIFLNFKNWRDEEYERKHDLPTENNDTPVIKSEIFSSLTYFRPEEKIIKN